MKKLIIAIDGPAGAGKSTVAQILAHRLHYNYIDTGAMYRGITWKAMKSNVIGNTTAIERIVQNIDIKLTYINGKTTVLIDGSDVTAEIRTPEVSRMVSEVAQVQTVREVMLQLQREMAVHGGVVMDGRDIGTHVLPNADIKIFLTASIKERAERRWRELTEKGFEVKLEELEEEIATRDKNDCEREFAPLVQASDAILIDTTFLSIEEAVEEITKICEERYSLV
ncbi:MAG: Cytidylate kinase [Pelosinus sp.]|nr:Cytidylate kinase [Pelosinus sp.]